MLKSKIFCTLKYYVGCNFVILNYMLSISISQFKGILAPVIVYLLLNEFTTGRPSLITYYSVETEAM